MTVSPTARLAGVDGAVTRPVFVEASTLCCAVYACCCCSCVCAVCDVYAAVCRVCASCVLAVCVLCV